MTGKVIYVSWSRLTSKTERDWYISDLINVGIEVEYWDVTALVRDDFFESTEIDRPYKRIVRSHVQLQAMLRVATAKGACFVMLFAFEGSTAVIYRVMSQYNARMVFICWGQMPIRSRRGSMMQTAFKLSPQVFFEKAWRKFRSLLYRRLDWIRPFEIVFAAGEKQLVLPLHARKVVPINLVDYDRALEASVKPPRTTQGRYAVFLDINLPYQSDLTMAGMKRLDDVQYFQSVNAFFDRVEALHGVSVVVAAHPKANYTSCQFGGRECIVGRTSELVRGSDFVISHHSTSIAYAVIFKKPIVFIHTDEMELLYRDTALAAIYDLAAFLDAPHCNIDRAGVLDRLDLKVFDQARYDDYKYGYLTTHQTERSTTKEIFLAEIGALL